MRRKPGRRRRPFIRQPQREHRINHEIREEAIRLVEIDGESQNEIVTVSDALQIAHDKGMDLVEISRSAKPPVCKILEYSKFAYDLKKKRKAQEANQPKTSIKEIRFGPNTDDHDLDFKLKHAEKFLTAGNKLKAYVQFRGRSIVHKDRGREVLDKVADHLSDLGKVEMEPKMNGRRMIMVMAPV